MSASSAMGGAHDGVLIVVIDARDPGLTQTQLSGRRKRPGGCRSEDRRHG
jgi:hypothetical protein